MIRVFHPSVAPFVQQAALAFHEAGILDRLVTTLVHDPSSRRQQALFQLAGLIGYPLEARWKRRNDGGIPFSHIESHPTGELLRLAAGLVDRDGRLTDRVWEWSETRFDRLVASGLHRGLSAVYGFEYSSLATLTQARALGIPCVYELPAPEPLFVQSILAREMQVLPELATDYHAYTASLEDRRTERRRAEWAAADVRVCASRFSRDSYAAAGLDTSSMIVIPYGAPEPVEVATAASGGSREEGPLTILWAGTFGMRKGAHYLLEAWRKGDFHRHVRLRIFGRVELPHRLTHPLPEGVEFGGSIPRTQLMQEYQRADLLVFPTLCDGFGLVATEAWSAGCPVIATVKAGASDLLRDQENGLLIESGSAEAILQAFQWALDHRAQVGSMRVAARDTAAAWQWSDYRRTLRESVLSRLPG